MDGERGKDGCVRVYACARKEIRKEGGTGRENRTTVGGKRYATAF